MHPATPLHEPPAGHFDVPAGAVFQAALETVRELPGWEVLTAHPEAGQIIARSRGRIFTPTREHVLRLQGAGEGTDLSIESRHARTNALEADERVLTLFRIALEERLRTQPAGPRP